VRKVTIVLVACAACGSTVIQPGHRGLLFSRDSGLRHDVLEPGYHRVRSGERIVDYDVTYSTRQESMYVTTNEGLQVDVKLAVTYRPIVAELYQLEGEIGASYYDSVIGPELRSAAREGFARHSFLDFTHAGNRLEDEIEVEVRRRTTGRHVELASVTLESVALPPEIVAAVRARQLAEQNALREKAERERAALREKEDAEAKWQKEKMELEHDVERRRLQRDAGASSPAR
jgi:regulator of protease activity HflC (stomatin/prohibitin superfamily)